MPYATLKEYIQTVNYLTVNERRLAWWQHHAPGKPVILFIHGFPSASWDWHHQWADLSTDYHLVSMDMLGYGLSDKPVPYGYTLAEQARFYLALLAHLNISKCHVLAHDYGDSVAQELLHMVETEQTQIQLSSITFLNGGLFSESHRPLLTQKLLKSVIGPWAVKFLNERSLEGSFKRIFGPQTPPKKHEIATLWQLLQINNGVKAMPYLLQYIDERKQRRQDWLDAMQSTQVPMLFINGRHDPISGEHMRLRWQQLLPHAPTCSLPVGHYPQIESAQRVTEVFMNFIANSN
ncbi:alpha/beta fold hydrolase [Planctobacterium marinum]|uniref:Epoxide hydrolase n=1 Tax=Planctobacterium marinum TaxID=1631968 RepID=A0AA48HX02_9ALTE|nr:epoxide hydrolase [Planctobacterium marinum]